MLRRSKRLQNRIDRLSDLPDGILHHILSFLDTRSSVRTSILSRRWTSVWKYVPVLTFTQGISTSDPRFEREVDQVLSLRSDSSSVSRVTAEFFPEGRIMDLFNRTMKYAASHDVQELVIHTRCHPSVRVIGLVCASYQSLKVLELQRTFIYSIDIGLFSRLQMLESLTLTQCFVAYGDGFTIPRLESLKLDKCIYCDIGNGVLKVTGPELLNLEIISRQLFNVLEIVAPKLQSFSLKIKIDSLHSIPYMSTPNLPSLSHANIKLFGCKHPFHGTSSSDDDAEKQQLLEQCVNMFKILHNVQTLNLEVETFELLIQACKPVKDQSSPFKRMKSLNLKCSEGSLDVPDEVIRFFFGGSPDEEDKRFTVEKIC